MRAAVIFALALTACSGGASVDAGTDAGPRVCLRADRCGDGERCAHDGVGEVELEPGESGFCVPATETIGLDSPRWPFRASATPLAARLCTAQGLWPGGGATERRRELLRQTGVRVVRLDFRWDRIERERGTLDFAAHDVMVDAALEDGLEVLGILAYGAPWATETTEDDPFHPPDDPADFASFAGATAGHFAGRVQRWEIWNEQNAGYRFWRPGVHGDAAAYADLLSGAAEAIDAACDDCRVLSGGLFFHEQLINGAVEFTDDMLTARPDSLERVDAFAFHPYPVYPPADPPELDGPGARSLGAMSADLEAVLARHGVTLPFAATELGWPVHGAIGEDEQAAILSRAMLLGAALDVEPLCWFNVTDGPDHGMFPPEDDFGLYRFGSEDAEQPIDPKPARDAMAFLSRIGDGAVFTGAVDDPALHDPLAGRFALDFEAPAGAWRVVFAIAPHDGVARDETRSAVDHLGRALTEPRFGPTPVFFLPPGL